jgi:hypothetical protein
MISVYPWRKNLLSVRYHLAFAGHGSAHLISERAPLEEADRPYFCPHGEREHVFEDCPAAGTCDLYQDKKDKRIQESHARDHAVSSRSCV